jgi:hypothetical protein
VLTGVVAFGLLLPVHLLVAGWPEPPPQVEDESCTHGLTPFEVRALAEALLEVQDAERGQQP